MYAAERSAQDTRAALLAARSASSCAPLYPQDHHPTGLAGSCSQTRRECARARLRRRGRRGPPGCAAAGRGRRGGGGGGRHTAAPPSRRAERLQPYRHSIASSTQNRSRRRKMFSLLYGFIELLLRKEQFHILVVGLDKAGKTSAVERLKAALTGAPPPDLGRAVPTVGLNVGRCEAFGASLVFWDLGGAPGLRVRRAGALFAVCIVALLRCAPSCVRGPEKRTRGAAPTPPFSHRFTKRARSTNSNTNSKTAATQFKKKNKKGDLGQVLCRQPRRHLCRRRRRRRPPPRGAARVRPLGFRARPGRRARACFSEQAGRARRGGADRRRRRARPRGRRGGGGRRAVHRAAGVGAHGARLGRRAQVAGRGGQALAAAAARVAAGVREVK